MRHQRLLLALCAAGVGGKALSWFASYLSDRFQRVVTQSDSSTYLPVSQGVPQGSVLGPVLFNLAVARLPQIAEEGGSTLLMYADDKFLYASHLLLAKAAEIVSSEM